jgi:hypothetical protein
MASWHSLPTELRLSVIAELDPHDVDSLAKTGQASYQACVPARFRVRPSFFFFFILVNLMIF